MKKAALFPVPALLLLAIVLCVAPVRDVAASNEKMFDCTTNIQPLVPEAPTDFHVCFDGIVLHDLQRYHALIIHGNAVTLRHAPKLVAPPDINVARLRDAAGQPVFCKPDGCRVAIDGLDIRIGGDRGSAPSAPASVSEDFDKLTPHLSCVTDGDLSENAVTPSLPANDIAGYVELQDGLLNACAFDTNAKFNPDLGNIGLHRFADRVSLDGATTGGENAALQIRSRHTLGKWVTIPRLSTSGPLNVRIENHSTSGVTSGKHFGLYRKVIPSNIFPVVCQEFGDANNPDCQPVATPLPPPRSRNCPYATGDVAFCPPRPVPAHMPPPSDTGNDHLEFVPGCANTQWP